MTNDAQTVVFADGLSASDVKQGGLGDCYLLSAMSVLAHTRPDMIRKLFHPSSREYREDGLYTVMMFRNLRPTFITVDDRFMVSKGSK